MGCWSSTRRDHHHNLPSQAVVGEMGPCVANHYPNHLHVVDYNSVVQRFKALSNGQGRASKDWWREKDAQ